MNLTESLPLGTEAPPPHWEEHRASHDMLFRTKPLLQVFASFSKEVEELDLSLVSWERLPGTHLKWLYSCCLQSRTCQQKLWRESACLDSILVMILDAHAVGMTRTGPWLPGHSVQCSRASLLPQVAADLIVCMYSLWKSAKLGVIKDILWASLALVGAVNLP